MLNHIDEVAELTPVLRHEHRYVGFPRDTQSVEQKKDD